MRSRILVALSIATAVVLVSTTAQAGGMPPAVADGIGTYDNANALFRLKNAATGGPADSFVKVGPNGNSWLALTANVDNTDAQDEVLLYDNASALLRVKNDVGPGPADVFVVLGAPGNNWILLACNIDADPEEEVALYDPTNGLLRAWNDYTMGGSADVFVAFGPRPNTWQPDCQDFEESDNTGELGAYDSAAALLRVKNTLGPGPADTFLTFGAPGSNWLARGGNWNGMAGAGLILVDRDNGLIRLKQTLTGGPADSIFSFGPTGNNWQFFAYNPGS